MLKLFDQNSKAFKLKLFQQAIKKPQEIFKHVKYQEKKKLRYKGEPSESIVSEKYNNQINIFMGEFNRKWI